MARGRYRDEQQEDVVLAAQVPIIDALVRAWAEGPGPGWQSRREIARRMGKSDLSTGARFHLAELVSRGDVVQRDEMMPGAVGVRRLYAVSEEYLTYLDEAALKLRRHQRMRQRIAWLLDYGDDDEQNVDAAAP